MGAHNTATLAAAAERIAFVAERLNPLSTWRATFDTIVAAEPRQVALKRWIAEGMKLDTLQAHVKLDAGKPAALANAWSPGARIVSEARSTFFQFDTGSRRDFAGLTCYAATDDYWIGFGDWSADTLELVCYRVLS